MYEQPPRGSLLQRHLFGAFGLTLLIALYLLPGAIGHEPWRGDDIKHFAVVYSMLGGEGWLFPHMAGRPLVEYPPLYHWVSALFASLLGPLLPLHDAARLATPFFAGLAIFWIARASARLYGRHTRTAAALLTVGTLGLVVHAHENQPLIALMAMQAMTLAGLALTPTQPVKGTLQACAGIALAFLSAGLAGLLLTLPLTLIVTLTCRECRSPRASGALILGLTLALLAIAAWPLALQRSEPELLSLWWATDWARLTSSTLSLGDMPRTLELLAWFIWPLWPIVLWSLWRNRRHLLQLPWMLPCTAMMLAAAWIYANGTFEAAAMLPLLPPMALIAAGGVPSLRRGAANAFDWFAVMTFGFFAILVWLAWSAQALFWPPGLARSLDRMAPELVLTGTTQQVALGVTIVLVWLLLVLRLPRTVDRGPINWAMGMTMLWCLAVTLLMPWFDYNRNYKPVVQALAEELENHPPSCIASMGLDPSHHAALDYHAGLRMHPVTLHEARCSLVLVKDVQGSSTSAAAESWDELWEYRHAGGRHLEVFRLYRR